jgi:hypothetical protein
MVASGGEPAAKRGLCAPSVPPLRPFRHWRMSLSTRPMPVSLMTAGEPIIGSGVGRIPEHAEDASQNNSLLKRERLRATCIRMVAVAVLAVASAGAHGQGGPPLVTDDPDTPGNGHLEINLATIGVHTPGRWEVDAPNVDINYGWGENIQLKFEAPWVFTQESPQAWKSGAGTAQVGIKWRFVDIEDSGFAMSTYPQLSWNLVPSSASRGITSPGRQLFLPIEAATNVGDFRLDAEVGRNFVQRGQDQWMAGVVVGHSCGETVECVGELHETSAPHNSQTLVNLGVHWKLSESLLLLASAGREFGPSTDDRQHLRFYLGFQLLP